MTASTRPPTISGQLSTAELMVEDRINTALTSPRFTADASLPSQVSYAVMREELKGRSAINASLQQEQSLAFKSSARREMHDLSVRNDEDAKQAASAIARVPGMQAQGMSTQEIFSNLVKEDPTLSFNKAFIDTSKTFDVMTEDVHETYMRENKQTLSELGIGKSNFDAEIAFEKGQINVDSMPMILDAHRKAIESGNIMINAEVFENQAKEIVARAEYNTAKYTGGRLHQSAGRINSPSGGTREDMERWEDFLSSRSLSIGDIPLFLSKVDPTPNESMFMTDPGSITKLAALEEISEKEVMNAITDLGDPALNDRADMRDPDPAAVEQIAKARRILRRGGEVFRQRNRVSLKAAEARDLLKAESEELASGYDKMMVDVRKSLSAAASAIGDGKTGNSGAHQAVAVNAANSFLASLSIKKGIPLYSNLNEKARADLVKKAGVSRIDLLSGDQIKGQGNNHGLWIDNSDPPSPSTTEGAKSLADFRYELTSWVDSALRPSFTKLQPKPGLLDTEDRKFLGGDVPPIMKPTGTNAGVGDYLERAAQKPKTEPEE